MIDLKLPKYKKIEQITNSNSGYISFSQGAVKVKETPQSIKDHILNLLESGLVDHYQYVGGIYELRLRLSQFLLSQYGTAFDPENILVTHGAIGAITTLCLTLLKSDDEVILSEPIYPSYENIIKFSKANPVHVQAFFPMRDQWQFQIERIEKAVTSRTKLIIISNPVNPCGTFLNKEDLIALMNLCEFHGIYLLCDEVYDNYIYEEGFCSGTSLVDLSERVIRIGSFSKDFSLSGYRIGYLVAPKPLISSLIAVQDGTLCCPSVIGQHIALFALNNRELIASPLHTQVKKNLEITCHYLASLVERGTLSYVKPKAGIYLFIRSPVEDSERMVMDILDKEKVGVVPGRDFGDCKDSLSHFRLCFARKETLVHEGMNRLLNYFGAKI